MWYLSPEASALSFFDKDVSVETKRKMVAALTTSADTDPKDSAQKRFYINKCNDDMNILKTKELDYLINVQSLNFFDRFGINKDFLQLDVEKWPENEDFLKVLNSVRDLQVVNDTAGKAVHLAEEYIKILTTKEDKKQYLLQIVSEYKNVYPNANKETLRKKLKTSYNTCSDYCKELIVNLLNEL